ncbi:MAG: tRNA (mo5U34)-methyltransferase [Solirubrobacteraceae bacterium]|nr:tRNA (mo5U34)-methyltransferase [Solirubrobacteraceae bacterium]
MPSPRAYDELELLAARTDFLWHQRFELAPGIFSPGTNDVDWLLHTAGVPADLTGASVLDIGTTNGGAAFAMERRGAEKVVATDIVDPMHFGFDAIRSALGSRVAFRQLSVYELSRSIHGQFDYVVFWGVLYHLRHPLLALDNVRAVTAQTAYVETAVCDAELGAQPDTPLARFYRLDELGTDSSNWFAPNVRALVDWCRSCGLEPTAVNSWPQEAASRAMLTTTAVSGPPEYQTVSYERPLLCSVAALGLDGRLHCVTEP